MFHVRAAVRAIAARAQGGREGQTLVEYGLLLTLIALVVMIALVTLGPVIERLFSNTAEALP